MHGRTLSLSWKSECGQLENVSGQDNLVDLVTLHNGIYIYTHVLVKEHGFNNARRVGTIQLYTKEKRKIKNKTEIKSHGQ